MSRIIKALLVIALLASCGGKPPDEQDDVTSTDTAVVSLDTMSTTVTETTATTTGGMSTDTSGTTGMTTTTGTDITSTSGGGSEGGAPATVNRPKGRRPRSKKPIRTTAPMPETPLPPMPAPAPRPESEPPLATAAPAGPIEMEEYAKVPVFYGTNRLPDPDDDRNIFGPDRGPRGRMQYGIGWVSIPRTHEPGELEGPWVRTILTPEDPSKHIVLLTHDPLTKNAFFGRLAASVPANNRQAFVFIHGYNVSFADAARRAAQIKFDLRFPGPAILFSWPSHGAKQAYVADQTAAEASVPELVNFLLDVRARSGADAIHIIAHSLGNRVLTRALERIDLDATIAPKPRFTTIVLAAPDIDANVFRDDLAPRMRRLADAITLYGSDDDLAIVASKKAHDVDRAGEGGDRLPIVEGIDSIDVTGLDASFLAHSYVGGVSVLGDIHQLICSRAAPPQRVGIQPRAPLAGWKLVKQAVTRQVAPCAPR